MAALDKNYDSPEYNITRDTQFDRVAITASTLTVAKFHARARMYVTNIIIGIRSVASVPGLNAVVQHQASIAAAVSATAATATWISATSIGSYHTIALNRTLAAGECLSLLFNDAKGKVFVSYEHQILPT